jgi:ketosteroid isomerase-like protein
VNRAAGAGEAAEAAASYLAAFATGDPDEVARHVSVDFVNEHTAALGSGCVGRDEYRRRLPGFLASFPGLAYEVEQLIADGDGDRVAVTYRMTASPTEGPVDIRGVMVIEVTDGLVRHRTDYWDSLTYLRQTDQIHLA